MLNIEEYKVSAEIKLKDFAQSVNLTLTKDDLEKELDEQGKKLGKLQDIMYAHKKYGVLIILQGMDASGKDGLVNAVFRHFNPRGTTVSSFKTPNELELKHDYLWRHYLALPERGKFAIFNRSHYENVLVTRVNPDYLLNEHLPNVLKPEDADDKFWQRRFKQINRFEKHIARNGTIVLKFFLNVSKDEQKKRLLDRLDDKDKHWKFAESDLKTRAQWNDYMVCYEDAINKTSKKYAPWFIIPADDKLTARYLVASIIHQEIKQYKDIEEPTLSEKELALFDDYRKILNKD